MIRLNRGIESFFRLCCDFVQVYAKGSEESSKRFKVPCKLDIEVEIKITPTQGLRGLGLRVETDKTPRNPLR